MRCAGGVVGRLGRSPSEGVQAAATLDVGSTTVEDCRQSSSSSYQSTKQQVCGSSGNKQLICLLIKSQYPSRQPPFPSCRHPSRPLILGHELESTRQRSANMAALPSTGMHNLSTLIKRSVSSSSSYPKA